MKKFLKNNIKLILVFLLGIIVSSGITAYAVNNYMSEQIRYQNNTFAINSVSEALDDLYSYSKEKIDNNTSNNYSTEEQVVGTWIDGKPIYRKYLLPSSPKVDDNVEKIVNIKIYFTDTNKTQQEVANPCYVNGDFYVMGYYIAQSKSIYINKSDSTTVDYLFVEYTKTTDTATN